MAKAQDTTSCNSTHVTGDCQVRKQRRHTCADYEIAFTHLCNSQSPSSHRTSASDFISSPTFNVEHSCFHMGTPTATFNNIIGPLPSLPSLAPPKSCRPSLQIHTEIFGIRKTSNLSDSVLRSLVFRRVGKPFPDRPLIYTDASTDSAIN